VSRSLADDKPNVFDYLDARMFLADLFEARKVGRKTYSYVSFTEELGFGRNSYGHQVISGTRALTEKAARKIVATLAFSPVERRYFLALVRHLAAADAAERETAFREVVDVRMEVLETDLSRDQLEYFSEWYHPVVREVVAFPDFSPDPRWIARQLKPAIKPDEAARSFELLQRIGFVIFDAKANKWRQTSSHLPMPSDVRSLALVRFHQAMLERAKESLLRAPAEEREIGAITLTVSDAEFKELKDMAVGFRKAVLDRFGHDDEGGRVERVAQVNLQVFTIATKEKA
jgi:uncharacterized protein (TIGR02147 family)